MIRYLQRRYALSRKGAVETMTYDEVLAKLREEIETKAL